MVCALSALCVASTVMKPRQRAKEIQDQIRSILVRDWNPIGVDDIPADEYDGYIGGIYRLLCSDASVEDIARHLHKIAMSSMGLSSGGPEDHHDVAKKLRTLDVRL